MALSLALHGLAATPLLLAGTSGGTPIEERALLIEIALAAPAPTDATGPADPQPSESRVDIPVPDQPPPVEPGEIADKKIELPKPEEPPPLVAADLERAARPQPPRPLPPPQPQPKLKPPAPPSLAPTHRAPKPAVTQAGSAPNAGTAQAPQGAVAQAPSLVWADKANFRVRPQPVYPPRAVELGQQGEAIFHVRLERDGSIAEIVLKRSSGHELLDRAAIAAVRTAQFQPEMRDGQPVAAWVQFPVRFHLR